MLFVLLHMVWGLSTSCVFLSSFQQLLTSSMLHCLLMFLRTGPEKRARNNGSAVDEYDSGLIPGMQGGVAQQVMNVQGSYGGKCGSEEHSHVVVVEPSYCLVTVATVIVVGAVVMIVVLSDDDIENNHLHEHPI